MNRITYFVFVVGLFIAVVNGYNLRGFIDSDDLAETDSRRRLNYYKKYNAAQKRQNQRDRRRFNPNHPNYNPNRNQWDEDRERWRKHKQAANIGRPRKDPYEPNRGNRYYARKREVARSNRCSGTGGLFGGGRDCRYVALRYDVNAGPGSQNHGARDYDPIHDKDYDPFDYGVGNSWWP